MPSAVVTGANAGIGHAFAQILVKEGYDVLAADINVGEGLKGLGCEIVQLDVSSPASIQAFKHQVKDRPVDLLLNIAGVMAPKQQDSLETVDEQVLKNTFAINTFGPLLLTQALLPNLLKSSHARVGVMSSRMGSIEDNFTGGSYSYRASKAALNSISKSMAVDLEDKNIVVVIMHPGIVRTSLVLDSYELKEAVEPDEAAGKLWKVLMSKDIRDTGKWWHREGQELPW
ncbi:short-chain alcohol dehydrogenase-like protein [Lepidopterella palustris CBS 459.81]|uniref:Short-chain alcohol dehydrogenase-like protein n=1 Tax=Lepidopterella palustris CBS 459.81 TaxID=1314670 RepID=A0A8E2E168_9PEZI|nr:short-chain alcohol dehydrogenase-like protein [Lepidopterella palustris CBS 459.81]